MRNIVFFLKQMFLPQSRNNYHPKTLQIDFLSYYLIFACLLAFLFKNSFFNLNNVLGFATNISQEKLFQLTNNERLKTNLPQLNYNQNLANAAYKKAQDMFTKNYWSHYAPDGTTPWDFIQRNNYRYEYAGENLAKNFLFSDNVVKAWMESQTHRENILKSEYTDVGFAVVNGVLNGEETTLVVQMFGKPQISSLSQQKNLTQLNNPPNILAKQDTSGRVNLTNFSLYANFSFIIFLALALLLDFYFAIKMNLFRIRGKNLAHLIFLGFIFLGLFYIIRGSIL